MTNDRTIVAVSTANGGAISLIRMSGSLSKRLAETYFSRTISEPNKCYVGLFREGDRIIDQVVLTWYAAPHSYTGEDMIEISCHGSSYITGEILRMLTLAGASAATHGEFTKRAFMNGKMNLSAAEAVGDLVASESRAAAEVAMSQMRGGYSKELSLLREKLLHIASLFELELDFSEEDVEFADRNELKRLLKEIKEKCDTLSESFALGNVLKNGIPVAIIGKPNVGKSTLLNALVGSERSIVSDIPGTTRDYIDETININGVMFRFIDTAGIRDADNKVEALGVERSLQQLKKAKVIIMMTLPEDTTDLMPELKPNQKVITVINKSDDFQGISEKGIMISAKYKLGISLIKDELLKICGVSNLNHDMAVVSNLRHFELLSNTSSTISEILTGIDNNLTSDILSHLLKDALQSIGTITGDFTTDEILESIFSRFCIGK